MWELKYNLEKICMLSYLVVGARDSHDEKTLLVFAANGMNLQLGTNSQTHGRSILVVSCLGTSQQLRASHVVGPPTHFSKVNN